MLLGLVVLMAGCFDVAQHVTKNGAGDIVSFIRFTFDKSLFSITEQMSGEPTNYDEMLEDAELTESEFMGSLPAGIEVDYQPVNSTARFGFTAKLTMNERQAQAPFRSTASLSPDDPALKSIFFPYLYENGLAIPFEGIEDAEEDSAPFLEASLYTISIGKPLMRSIGTVHVVPPGEALGADNRVDVEVTDYEDYNLVEIPLSLFMGPGTRLVVLLP